MNREFDQLVDVEGLAPEEQTRLRRVHELLVAAGPPPELTAALQYPPRDLAVSGGNVVAFPGLRRRPAAALVLAATIAAACFGGGYVLANQAHHSSIHVIRVVDLQGKQQNSVASLRVGAADQNGNWPIELTVSGLPPLKSPRAYYILMLWQHGKPGQSCGTFRVEDGTTTVRLSVPYKITKTTRWVVTAMAPGSQWPGHVVMKTA